jgi:hypothetical protein
MLRRRIQTSRRRADPHPRHVPRQPKHLLQTESTGRCTVYKSCCVVDHFQHLSHESRGEATVGLLHFLFITTFFWISGLLRFSLLLVHRWVSGRMRKG